jgi:diamine N-acetyltransferase
MNDLKITLRAPEPEDLDVLYRWENDERVWLASNHSRPLSKNAIQLFIESINDIFTDKQVRFMIDCDGESVGCVDLFDYEPLHQRACIGIMIDNRFEGRGFAGDALNKLKEYAFSQLGLHQLYCTIAATNERSISLFKKCGFQQTGTRIDWLRINREWIDELTFQCFNSNGEKKA